MECSHWLICSNTIHFITVEVILRWQDSQLKTTMTCCTSWPCMRGLREDSTVLYVTVLSLGMIWASIGPWKMDQREISSRKLLCFKVEEVRHVVCEFYITPVGSMVNYITTYRKVEGKPYSNFHLYCKLLYLLCILMKYKVADTSISPFLWVYLKAVWQCIFPYIIMIMSRQSLVSVVMSLICARNRQEYSQYSRHLVQE